MSLYKHILDNDPKFSAASATSQRSGYALVYTSPRRRSYSLVLVLVLAVGAVLAVLALALIGATS